MAKNEQKVGKFKVVHEGKATEFEIVLRPRQMEQPSASAQNDSSDFPIPLNVTLDEATKASVREICRREKLPKYRGLQPALEAIAKGSNRKRFVEFVTQGQYVEPSRIRGQQSHFRLSQNTHEVLNSLCWECAAGNKSLLVRAAVGWFNKYASVTC